MCLENMDIDSIEVSHDCYLTHPDRSDDSDDVLLDAANQCDLTKKDLVRWATSARSFCFMDEIDNISDIDVSDFRMEFEPLSM